MKIVCDEAVLLAQTAFAGEGKDELILLPAAKIDADAIRDADALIVRSTVRVDDELLRHHVPAFIATATVGTDHIDFNALSQTSAKFVSAQGSSAPSVAQFTWAMMVHLAHMTGRAPTDLRLGVVGCGEIGERVARCGERLGLQVRRVDPPLRESTGSPKFAKDLGDSNLISLHVPLTCSGDHPTKGIVNKAWLARLPRGSLLLNTARGDLIVPDALVEARKNGILAGIGLDVFPHEPRISHQVLATCDLATPHVAGRSWQGMLANTQAIAQAFCQFFSRPAIDDLVPSERPETIVVSGATTPEEFLVRAWNMPGASQVLRQTMTCPESQQGAAFSRLRRPPYRQDLTSYPIDGTMSLELEDFLSALETTNSPLSQDP